MIDWIELEIVHMMVFYLLSIFFLVLAVVIGLKENNLNKNPKRPNKCYLKMRQESDQYYNEIVRGLTRFEHLRILISESIRSEVAGNILQTEEETEVNIRKKILLEEECGSMFLHMVKRFPEISWKNKQKRRIKLAVLFEANRRFIKHPFDLRGLRQAKVFQNILNVYLRKAETSTNEQNSNGSLCISKVARIFNPSRRFVSTLGVAIIAAITVGVNIFDFFTDFKVIEIFWEITNKAEDFKNGTKVLWIIPALYSGPSFFMSGVFCLSVFISLFHIRSIFYYLQVSLHMESSFLKMKSLLLRFL